MTSYITGFLQDLIVSGINTFVNDLLNDLFYMVFMVENNLTSSAENISINFNSIYAFIYGWAAIILVLVFIKKMITCYMTWSSGDPDTSPLVLVVNFVKSLIVMIIFGQIYKLVIPIAYEFYKNILTIITVGQTDTTIITATVSTAGLAWTIAIVIVVCCWIALIFQLMMKGIEILVLRLIMPFVSIGLLNSDGGAFNIAIKKFLQNVATVIVQVALVKLSVQVAMLNHIIYAIGIAMVALRTPVLIQEFLSVRPGTPVNQRVKGAVGGAVAAWRDISLLRR